MEQIAGIPSEQIVNVKVLIDFPESTLKDFRPYYLKAKNTLKSVFYDLVPVETPSGRQSFQSGWLIPIEKEGEYKGMICTVEDVTERMKAEQELKESEEKFRTIAEESIVGISIIQDDVIKYINQTFLDIIGYTQEKIQNWKPGDLFEKLTSPEQREEVREISQKNQSGKTKYTTNKEIKIISKNGDIFWIEFYARSIIYQGRP